MLIIRVGGMACARVHASHGELTTSELCAVDTAALYTLLPSRVAEQLKLEPAGDVTIVSASQRERVSTAYVELRALGQSRRLRVMLKSLPPGTPFRGLLGLDFFEGRRLELDFAAGTVELS